MPRRLRGGFGLGVAILAGWQLVSAGQLPLAPGLDKGRTVTPAFEGWYTNPDGTFTLSFGYYNRNLGQAVDIPVGPNNRLEPGGPDMGQPTHFMSRRHYGTFTVTVPKDFGTKEIVWTLVSQGQTLSIPGNLRRQWMIDAISGDADGNRPPVLKFVPTGPTGQGPRGLHAPPLTATVSQPLSLSISATDDGVRSRAGTSTSRRQNQREAQPITVMWLKHRGPGRITFSEPKPKLEGLDVQATTTATFSEPGDYIVRAHVFDYSGEDGSNQCCWTNGYVKVSVK